MSNEEKELENLMRFRSTDNKNWIDHHEGFLLKSLCICNKSNWDSLKCPIHGLDVKD